MPDVEHGGYPIYMCARGRDDEPGTLYLYLDAGTWTAVQVIGTVVSAADIVGRGLPALRAATADEDVREPGRHLWACHDNRTSTWWPPSLFITKTL